MSERPRSPESRAAPCGPVRAIAPGLAVFLAILTAGGAEALPPDPARPLAPQTCAEAQARLAEARAGSPLVGAAEQALIAARLDAAVQALCGCAPDR